MTITIPTAQLHPCTYITDSQPICPASTCPIYNNINADWKLSVKTCYSNKKAVLPRQPPEAKFHTCDFLPKSSPICPSTPCPVKAYYKTLFENYYTDCYTKKLKGGPHA